MRKNLKSLSFLPLLIALSGCNATGDKTADVSLIYCVTGVLALILLVAYFWLVKKKDTWFLLLFGSLLVVNMGYLALSLSQSLEQALFANRVVYLGSVCLPLSMWMIILRVTGLKQPKWLSGALIGLAAVMFFITASPGYLDIYYKEVTFERVNGVVVLNKVYGPLHVLNLIYLLGYFGAMVTGIVYATVKDRVESVAYAAILAVAVFINIGIWMLEQLVRIDFEFLSVSYIISGSFLLGLHLFMAENERKKEQIIPQPAPELSPAKPAEPVPTPEDQAAMDCFVAGVAELTAKEKMIYDCYVAGMTTSQIMTQLNIKENTLKFHNKNIYSKLGVSSRKRLVALHKSIYNK